MIKCVSHVLGGKEINEKMIMTQEYKELLLKDGTWFAIGLVLGAILGGLVVMLGFGII